MTGKRDVVLKDVFNLRDLGGYETADGRRTRWGTLYRGAGLHRLAGEDLRAVQSLALRTVVDLRTAGEVQSAGTYPVDQLPADFYHLPMITSMWDHSAIDPTSTAAAYLVERYLEMLSQGRSTIVESVRLLSRPGALPGVFYCAAGKDRTGTLAAVLLDAIGVERDQIIADYHLSKERVARILARARTRGRGEAQSTMLAQPPAVLDAPAHAMRLLLQEITERYGSTADYLLASGLRPDELRGLEDALLEVR